MSDDEKPVNVLAVLRALGEEMRRLSYGKAKEVYFPAGEYRTDEIVLKDCGNGRFVAEPKASKNIKDTDE